MAGVLRDELGRVCAQEPRDERRPSRLAESGFTFAHPTWAEARQWEPEGVTEKIGAALGMDDRRVQGDLQRFKELIERRGAESGAWRGEVGNPSD